MRRRRLTDFDTYPEAMILYMRYNGPHFNKKLCDFAVSKMTKRNNKGELVSITPYRKEEVENLLRAHGITLRNNQLYDFVYVANMAKADFLNSSVPDEHYLSLYIKDVIDDVDAPDGLVFNRWYADTSYMGIAIDWEEML